MKNKVNTTAGFYAPISYSHDWKRTIGCTCKTVICKHNALTTGYATYAHVYRTAGFNIVGQPPPKKTHACLLGDHWCWKNAFENPFMAVRYIIWKINKML